ncbi:hypothetical protein MNB_SV-12-518 [hydrothermal vent metagenome]|uniref:Uncharacterized protein n=1 Tax=hydrothermal vent metagenome TaxID=652676 RepID=A0A1W1CNQ1_9ZZZZ
MLKIFLSLIAITLFIVIGIDSISLENNPKEIKPKETTLYIEPIKEKPVEIASLYENKNSDKKEYKDNSIYDEIKSLFEKADSLTNPNNYRDALEIYNKIIDMSQNRDDTTLLKSFAKAYFSKAYIFTNYSQSKDEAIVAYDSVIEKFVDSKDEKLLLLYYHAQIQKSHLLEKNESIKIYDEIIDKFKNSDSTELLKKFASAQFAKSYLLSGEESIDIYDEIINRFKHSDDKKLLKELSTAQFAKAYLLNDCLENKMEAIEVYDEIIERFSSYEGDLFQKEITDALFFKSFLLMGDYRQESMEIFDEIIDRCKVAEDGTVPRNFEYSVINNIELALITNDDDTKYRDLANKYLSHLEDTRPQLEMLTILRNAQELNQDKAIQRWKDEYKDYHFENWSFEELKKWNNQMEDKKERDRIRGYLNDFIKHSNTTS